MKLLKLLFIPVCVLLLYACQDDEGARPSMPKPNTDVLGLVVPHANESGELEKVLFLKDGRVVNPVSGIPNFDGNEFGAKLLITFNSLETFKAKKNGVLDVSVTSYSYANDSTFVPSDTVFVPGDSIFTPIDSVFVPPTDTVVIPGDTVVIPGDSVENPIDSIHSIIYKGTFVMFNTDSTSGNEYVVSDTLTLTLDGRNFDCVTTNNFPLGGAGTFVVTPTKIKFKNDLRWIQGDQILALDGWFNYFKNETDLYLFAYRDGVYISYHLRR